MQNNSEECVFCKRAKIIGLVLIALGIIVWVLYRKGPAAAIAASVASPLEEVAAVVAAS